MGAAILDRKSWGPPSWTGSDVKCAIVAPILLFYTESVEDQTRYHPPTAASSPIVQEPKEAKGKAAKAALNLPLRILFMNCQSIKNKKAELHTIIDSAKPDIILGNESWLTPEIKNSENFSNSFDAVRKDRASDAHGGVFIAFKRGLLCTEFRN